MSKIKYMGSSDVRLMEKGEDFGGRLADPLDRDIAWSWDNKHVIDTSEHEGVSDEFWSLLLEESDFKDVSDAKLIPTNEAQQIWRGMKKSEPNPDLADDEPDPEATEEARQAAEALGATNDDGTAGTDEDKAAAGGPSEASEPTPRSTTTGGSTRGGRRGT